MHWNVYSGLCLCQCLFMCQYVCLCVMYDCAMFQWMCAYMCQWRSVPALARCDARARIPSASAAERKPTSPPHVHSSQSGHKSARTSLRRYYNALRITVTRSVTPPADRFLGELDSSEHSKVSELQHPHREEPGVQPHDVSLLQVRVLLDLYGSDTKINCICIQNLLILLMYIWAA